MFLMKFYSILFFKEENKNTINNQKGLFKTKKKKKRKLTINIHNHYFFFLKWIQFLVPLFIRIIWFFFLQTY